MGICSMTQGTQRGALYQPRGMEWRGNGREVQKGEGIYVYLWLIHRFDRN